MENPVYLTPEQACQLLNIKRSRLYHLTSLRRIPHLKFGTSLRFERRELLRWVERQRNGPHAA